MKIETNSHPALLIYLVPVAHVLHAINTQVSPSVTYQDSNENLMLLKCEVNLQSLKKSAKRITNKGIRYIVNK